MPQSRANPRDPLGLILYIAVRLACACNNIEASVSDPAGTTDNLEILRGKGVLNQLGQRHIFGLKSTRIIANGGALAQALRRLH
jgi:hypothetical protein